MARPRSFETDEVVSAAMACFREHGFGGTSIRDLEVATGLKAASLYNSFGNKAALFALTLERYRASVLARRIETHLRPERGIDGIKSFFTSTYQIEPDPEHGCLLANSAIEFAVLDPPAREIVEAGLTQLRDAFDAQIRSCQSTGTVHPGVDPHAAAQQLVVTYEGMLLLARTGQTLIDLDAVVDVLVAPMATRPPTPTEGDAT